MEKGKLYLIPTYLSNDNDSTFIAPVVCSIITKTTYFLVENLRTARRFISSLKLEIDITSLHFELFNKDTHSTQMEQLLTPLNEGHDIGIMSEAGFPGIADPGNLAIHFAHTHNVEVICLPGASSILMALASSGFNGQQFTFNGYLPVDSKDLSKKLNELYQTVLKDGFTQLFMETPYRNLRLLKLINATLPKDALLFIGANLSAKNQFALTKPISYWINNLPNIHKVPSIFALGRTI